MVIKCNVKKHTILVENTRANLRQASLYSRNIGVLQHQQPLVEEKKISPQFVLEETKKKKKKK